MTKEIAILKRKSKVLTNILRIASGKRKESQNIQQLIKEKKNINNLLK
jgi:hypothetical protein